MQVEMVEAWKTKSDDLLFLIAYRKKNQGIIMWINVINGELLLLRHHDLYFVRIHIKRRVFVEGGSAKLYRSLRRRQLI